MALDITPERELSFTRPLTQMVREILTLRNNNNAVAVAFKVKTTSPKQYCVRPNAGIIQPNQAADIQVILQPLREDPPPDYKTKDKFLVQSCAVPDALIHLQPAEILASVERDAREQLHEQKLKCVFLPATQESIARAQQGDEHLRAEFGNAANPPSTDASSLLQDQAVSVPAKKSDQADVDLRGENAKLHDIIRQLRADAEKKQRELEDARIALKKVKMERSQSEAKVAVKQSVQLDDGLQVPVQTVLIVALLAFLIGYLFF